MSYILTCIFLMRHSKGEVTVSHQVPGGGFWCPISSSSNRWSWLWWGSSSTGEWWWRWGCGGGFSGCDRVRERQGRQDKRHHSQSRAQTGGSGRVELSVHDSQGAQCAWITRIMSWFHLCVCEWCASNIVVSNKQCPVCWSMVVQILKVYSWGTHYFHAKIKCFVTHLLLLWRAHTTRENSEYDFLIRRKCDQSGNWIYFEWVMTIQAHFVNLTRDTLAHD